MKIKKYLSAGAFALALGMTSCVGDLDLKPIDPNLVDTSDPNFAENSLAICYSGITCSGYGGPGDSYVKIDGLDAGTSAYLRLLFTLNEFCTDEMIWIWPDAGIVDITGCTWGQNNVILNGAYYRLMGHIAICNQFLINTASNTDEKTLEMRAQARVLRAYSYYNLMDLFGKCSFITDEDPAGSKPVQKNSEEMFAWLEKELTEIVDNKLISENPKLGQVGLDGAEGLLARLLLNAEVFTGTGRWADCQVRCENIIARHQGGGFDNSGLANHYLYLFCKDNKQYMPGGDNEAENEILFGFCFDADYVQSYGGPTFIIAGTISNTHYMPRQIYGCGSDWSCIRGCQEMAERFYGISDQDVRDDLWLRGVMPEGNLYEVDKDGNLVIEDGKVKVKEDSKWEEEDYSDRFAGFTGEWKTTGGNAIIKFTNRTMNAAKDGGWAYSVKEPAQYKSYNGAEYRVKDETYQCEFPETPFSSTSQPIIRLADIYLMYAECNINGNCGDRNKALNYVNLVRRRAGAPTLGSSDLTRKGIMDERSRELYLEMTRRSDLVRNKMFSGPTQTVWQYKGSATNNDGTRIAEHMSRFPVPYAVIAAQPEFTQNPGY